MASKLRRLWYLSTGPLLLLVLLCAAAEFVRWSGRAMQTTPASEVRDGMDTWGSITIAITVAICGGAVTAIERVQVKRDAARAARQPVPSADDLMYRVKRTRTEIEPAAPWLMKEITDAMEKIVDDFRDPEFVQWLAPDAGDDDSDLPPSRPAYVDRATSLRDRAEHLRGLLALPDSSRSERDYRESLLQALRAIENACRLRLLASEGRTAYERSVRLVWQSAGFGMSVAVAVFSPDLLLSNTLMAWGHVPVSSGYCAPPTAFVYAFLFYCAAAFYWCGTRLRLLYLRVIRL